MSDTAELLREAADKIDEMEKLLRRFVEIWAWQHDEAHAARTAYDNAARDGATYLDGS